MSAKYYAVKIGRTTGIFNTWDKCKEQTNGFKGAVYKSFKTNNEAVEYLGFSSSLPDKSVLVNNVKLDKDKIIYVDGGHNKITGDSAFGSVVDGYGNDLIYQYNSLFTDMKIKYSPEIQGGRHIIVTKFSDATQQQNNGAELLAAIAGMRIVLYNIQNNNTLITHILSDSDLIIKYWSKRLDPIKEQSMDPLKVTYVKELIQLNSYLINYGCTLFKVSGDSNLADLGFHRG